MSLLAVTIRRAVPDDAEAILKAHREAVFAKAAAHYTVEQMAAWAAPPTAYKIADEKKSLARPDLIAYVATHEENIIGFAMALPSAHELRAIYSVPGPWAGLGSRLLLTVEEEIRRLHVRYLACDASLNSENFYRRHGFTAISRATHPLRNGVAIPCIKMMKRYDV